MLRYAVTTLLPKPPQLPSPDELASQLRAVLTDWAEVQWCASTGSTNTDLLQAVKAGAPAPRLLGTHLQEQGRGRAGRSFQAGAGDALMFSCAFATSLPLMALPTLSVAFGLAATDILAANVITPDALSMKWPNDIQWHGAKLAGLLTEAAPARSGAHPHDSSGVRQIVIGMGMNLRGADRLSHDLGRAVADWACTGSAAPIHSIVAGLARAWQETVAWAERTWQSAHGLAGLASRHARRDALRGQPISVQDQGEELYRGIAAGIDDFGHLLVDTPAGRTRVVAGDISVRPRAAAPRTSGR